MVDAPSIGELCDHARNACLMAGLTPVAWRWSIGAHMQFLQKDTLKWKHTSTHEMLPDMPPGCFAIYEGLPVFRMGCPPAFPHPAVACIGTRDTPAF